MLGQAGIQVGLLVRTLRPDHEKLPFWSSEPNKIRRMLYIQQAICIDNIFTVVVPRVMTVQILSIHTAA